MMSRVLSCRARTLLGALVASSLLLAAPARAEAPEVAEQYEQGKQALKADKPAEALTHFKAALSQADRSLGSTWQMLLAVALTYQKLEQPAFAAEMFRRFLAVTEEHSALMTQKWKTRRELVLEDLTDLERKLSKTHVVVMVTSKPAGAAIAVDGAAAGADGDAITPTRLWLSPGEHVVSLTSAGHQPFERSLSLTAGQLDSVSVSLTPLVVETPEAPASEPESELSVVPPAVSSTTPVGDGDGGSVGPWIVLGGAGVAAIVGGVMVGLAEAEYATITEMSDPGYQPTDLAQSQRDLNAARDNYGTYDTRTWVMFGVAGAAAAGGVVWLLVGGDEEQGAESTATFGLFPTHGGVHGHATWRF